MLLHRLPSSFCRSSIRSSPPQRLVTTRSLPEDYESKLKPYKVLVAGATGKTGRCEAASTPAISMALRTPLLMRLMHRCIVDLLRGAGVPVRALVRDTEKAVRFILPGEVEV